MDRVRKSNPRLSEQRRSGAFLAELTRRFTPNWFSVTMGTGILALALNQFPLPVPGIRDVAGGLWLLDIVLFASFTALYAACWTHFFDAARGIFDNSVLSMFLGAIPMGLATIINGIVAFSAGGAGNCIA
jgi:tellurite resistance protein TehA-like permease